MVENNLTGKTPVIGVVLLCRYSSSRLPGKIFMDIEGQPVISYIFERILSVVDKQNFCVATSVEPADDSIAGYCRSQNVRVFRGSLQNVADRFLQAALTANWDYAVRINGDNLFVETDVMRHLMQLAASGQYDFLSNTHNKTFPQGMSVEIVNTAFFRKAYKNFRVPEDFEHITYFFHNNKAGRFFYYDNESCPEARGLKFAIDEQKDLDLCRQLMASMKASHLQYKMKEIVQLYKTIQHDVDA